VTTHTGRSRGYGFVTFENEEDQLKALKALDGKKVVGTNGNSRFISFKIAFTNSRRQLQVNMTRNNHFDTVPKSTSGISDVTTASSTIVTSGTINMTKLNQEEKFATTSSSVTSSNSKSFKSIYHPSQRNISKISTTKQLQNERSLFGLVKALKNMKESISTSEVRKLSVTKAQLRDLLSEGSFYISNSGRQRHFRKLIAKIANEKDSFDFLNKYLENFDTTFRYELSKCENASPS
jgi:RNA recognition motif-containing protein